MSYSNHYLILKVLLFISCSCLTLSLVQADCQQNDLKNCYTIQELVNSGHVFFDEASGNLTVVIETIFKKFGIPNGYIIGEEFSSAMIGGITYGEGILHSKNFKNKVFWQGPSLGFDFGAQGSRVVMLVYNLGTIKNLWGRYGGISGSAYAIAGTGFHILAKDRIKLIPIRTGIGARLGINIGYLKLTSWATWNPF